QGRIPQLVMVIYESGSLYEQFLFSGLGSGHYDAARENSDGSLRPYWYTAASQNISTGFRLLPGVANYTARRGGAIASEKFRRAIQDDGD
ncbi:MAG: hypothetical protein Q9183_007662, partial [Haloplaca sp. 2 TL-2023]